MTNFFPIYAPKQRSRTVKEGSSGEGAVVDADPHDAVGGGAGGVRRRHNSADERVGQALVLEHLDGHGRIGNRGLPLKQNAEHDHRYRDHDDGWGAQPVKAA